MRSLPPLLSLGVLISLMLFLYGMAGYYMFGADLPDSWGSITVAMTTLFILLTLENFPVYLEEAVEFNAFALPFFLSYVFVIVFTVLNVLIGIVLHSMDQAREEHQQREREISDLQHLADGVATITEDGMVTPEEVQQLREELKKLRQVNKDL
jgi:voltage-gated sodium channel